VRPVSSGLPENLPAAAFGGSPILSVGYGNGVFVATGGNGKMAHSSDGGRHWTPVQSGNGGTRFDGDVFAVAAGSLAAGGNPFFAAGAGGRMSFSANGIHWNGIRLPSPPQVSGQPPPPYGVALFYGEDIFAVSPGGGTAERFVAAGGGGRTAFRWFNTAGHLWEWSAGTGIDPDRDIFTVTWGETGEPGITGRYGGRFVAAGSGGAVYRATDAAGSQQWQRAAARNLEGYAVRASAAGNGVFVLGGEGGRMARSFDGLEWQPVNAADVFGAYTVRALAFGSGVFVAGGEGGKMAWSPCGAQWHPVSGGGFTQDETVTGIATDRRSRFVAVGGPEGGTGRIVSWYQKPRTGAAAASADF